MSLILLLVSVIFANSIQVTESEWSLVFKDEFNDGKLDSFLVLVLNYKSLQSDRLIATTGADDMSCYQYCYPNSYNYIIYLY
jgi:hypothetical protein